MEYIFPDCPHRLDEANGGVIVNLHGSYRCRWYYYPGLYSYAKTIIWFHKAEFHGLYA